MNKRVSSRIFCLGIILVMATGCIVNKAIPASAIADNLAVEKAQNEMLLLNVLRGKDHNPMVVTGISKITGSIKAEATLGATIPVGSFRGDGSRSASNYVASPGATYNWNPSFDVNVFDTSEFMHGFLTPVSVDVLAYYWNLGFYPEVLLNLMVLKVDVKKVSGCGDVSKKKKDVVELILPNNHEWGDTDPVELKRFGIWIDHFLEKANPYFVEGKAERLGPEFEAPEAQRALIKGLKEGLTLAEAKGGKFQFERVAPPRQILTVEGGDKTLEFLYNWTELGFKGARRREGDERDCPSATTGGASVQLMQSEPANGDDRYSITFFLRSPEAILYYLGELARIEEKRKETAYYCLGGKLQPLFVVLRGGECDEKKSVQATSADGVSYAIPVPADPPSECCCKKTEWAKVTCDGGRSMEALTVVAQLIALQKSAKDLPTTSVVRVVGQ